MTDLTQYKRIVTSQEGEDGIIEIIFQKLNIQKGFCVEFGAWDGKLSSNTWNLWHNEEWSAVLIEGDAEKATQLSQTINDFPKVRAIHTFVNIRGEDSLDNILQRENVPTDFELLSIDIDGDDYYIWKSLQNYSPKLVIIEHNPTFPPHVEFIDQPGSRDFGCSALALVNLGKEKGYELICCTVTNSFFLRKELLKALGIQKTSLEELFQYDRINYVVSSYKGCAFVTKNELCWVYIDSLKGIYRQFFSSLDYNQHQLNRLLFISHDFFDGLLPGLRFFQKVYQNIKKIVTFRSQRK
ncbi:MAG: hypothetical protein HQM12_15055 [SAR324 cluster bacterium]|nr:hypothetical protein [SAR324 cluster bacterium]